MDGFLQSASSASRYLLALARVNFGTVFARPWLALGSSVMMFGNNLIFFLIWVIYFANFSSLGSWGREDLALLIGIFAWAFGLAVFVAGGSRDIAQIVRAGELDLHLGRPRHPLPGLLMSRSAPSGPGDLASALVFWLFLAGREPAELPLLILVSTSAAIVIVATTTIIQCLVFWLPSAAPLCEELFNTFMMIAAYPQHPFGLTTRIVLFTVFPTAFVALLPVEAIREPDMLKVFIGFAAALFYAGLAVIIFDRGSRRYVSGNQMLELR